jgi:hypothetical protein
MSVPQNPVDFRRRKAKAARGGMKLSGNGRESEKIYDGG